MNALLNTERRLVELRQADTADEFHRGSGHTDSDFAGTIRILGPIEVCNGDEPLALGGLRQVSVLVVLALHANRAVSGDALIEAVWGHRRSGAHRCLLVAISRLRRTLGLVHGSAGIELQSIRGGYQLSLPAGTLDAEVFQSRLLEARRALAAGAPSLAAELATSALNLWRGPALMDVAFEDFAQSDIRHLEGLQLLAHETRIEADLRLGRHADLVSELEALAQTHPGRERLAGQLMLALYRSGRQADALEAYEDVRVHLACELGLEPGPALKELQAKILRQDPSVERSAEAPSRATAPAASNHPASTIDCGNRSRKVSISLTRPRASAVVSSPRATPNAPGDCTPALHEVRITRWLRFE